MKNEYTNDQIKRLRNEALIYGRRRKLGYQEAEDYAQYVLMKVVVEGKRDFLFTLFVDFARSKNGRPESYKSRGERMTLHEFQPVDGFLTSPDLRLGLDKMSQIGVIGEIENRVALGNIYLSETHRKVLYMTLGGFEYKETAKILGINRSRVSQIVTELNDKFLGTYKKKPSPLVKRKSPKVANVSTEVVP